MSAEATLGLELSEGTPAPSARGGTRPASAPPEVFFWLLMGFFVLEYMRPPAIVKFKLQLLFILFFPLIWLVASPRPWSRNLSWQVAFVAVCGLTVPLASNNFTAYMTTRVMYGHVVVAIAITWVLSTWRNFTRGVWIWVGIMSYQAFYALTHGGRGSGGFVGDENDLSLACVSAFAFTFVGFRALPGLGRLVAGAACVLFASAVVVSFSRGGFVALAVTGLYCVWTGRHRVRNLLLGVLGALVFFLVIPSDYKTELGTISDTESGTADVRQFMWAAATNMWQDNPLLGVGAGNSSWRIGDYQPRDDPRFDQPQYTERNWTTQQVHSMYFQLLSELGIVGITVLGSIVVGQLLLLRNLRRRIARLRDLSPRAKDGIELYAVALAGGMVAFLSAGAFLSVLYYPYPYYFSAMAVAFSRAAVERAPALAES